MPYKKQLRNTYVRLPAELVVALRKIARQTGRAYQTILTAAISRGLPLVIKELKAEGRELGGVLPELDHAIQRPHVPFTPLKIKCAGRTLADEDTCP